MVVRAVVGLAGGENGAFFRREGDEYVLAATHGQTPGTIGMRLVPDAGSIWGRAVLSGRRFHYADTILAEPKLHDPERRRTRLAVPVRHGGETIGVVLSSRNDPGGFEPGTIALVETFADQLAVAMENARLLTETKTSLTQQTATADVLRAISRSAFDLNTILRTLAVRAAEVCGADNATLSRIDGGMRSNVASSTEVQLDPTPAPISPGSGLGRMVKAKRSIQIPDIREDSFYEAQRAKDLAAVPKEMRKTRTILVVPLRRDQLVIGAFLLRRDRVRTFTDGEIALVETFADQAVIAIENVRLFNETKEALERQTATSEILKVIAASPSDIAPVLDAIAESAGRFCAAENATVIIREDDGLLHPRATVGPLSTNVPPWAIDRTTVTGRSMIEARTIQVDDLQTAAAEYPGGSAQAVAAGYHTTMAAPLIRNGRGIGALLLRRADVRPFSDKQLELVRIFADQAVIAIENVRLFNETKDALERQTATAEILRAISGSPTDVQPVLDTIAASALRYCAAEDVIVLIRDGLAMRARAHVGSVESGIGGSMPLDRHTVGGRAIVDATTVSVDDLPSNGDFALGQQMAKSTGHRSTMASPMLRGGDAVGAILLRRSKLEPFTPRQIELAESFASQAVIAIENVRLFNETNEALGRQTATAEVLKAISGSALDLDGVLNTVITHATRLSEAENGFLYQADGDQLAMSAAFGPRADVLRDWQRENPIRSDNVGSATGRAFTERRTVHIPDVDADPTYTYADAKRLGGFKVLLSVPLSSGSRSIGVIALWRTSAKPFSAEQIALVETFADQAVIAIENARLFNETNESLERQTALGEILQVIASSPTDQQPVLDAIVRNAVRFCGGEDALLRLPADGGFRTRAHHGPLGVSANDELHVIDRESVLGRAVIDGVTVQAPDLLSDVEFPTSRKTAERLGFRAVLATPLLREGEPIGVIALRRSAPGLYSARDEELLRAFAAQAVIALENVRLFNETKAALEQQTAISDILKVISASPTDIQPVLDAIAVSAGRFAAAEDAAVMLVRDGELHPSAHQGPVAMPTSTPLDRGSVAARAVLEVRTVHSADVTTDPEFPLSRRFALGDGANGQRAVLAAPLVRGDVAIGAIVLRRREPLAFSDRQIELVQTFADQAVIALANTRLFKETQEALERQTATAELLAAMSQSAFDLKPVFEMVLDKSLALCRAEYGWIRQTDRESNGRMVASRRPDDAGLLGPDVQIGRTASIMGRAFREQRTVHIRDVTVDPTVADSRSMVAIGARTGLGVPLLRGDDVLGVLVLVRLEVQPFTEREIELVESFARQAAIAIENVRLFNEIQEKSAQLEVANRHKSVFLANMSHELRTPLNAIIGFSEVLIQRMFGELNAQQADYLEDIRSSGTHLLSLINDILDLSKIEAGKMELELSSFSLVAALDNAITLIRERASSHGIRLQVEVAPPLDTVVADERKLKQVMVNLLTNAVKFTPDGGTVSVRASREPDAITVAVHDTGIGIAPEDQQRIFEEFTQATHQGDRSREGTGLGLSLTRRIVELHGGTIGVQSVPGKGSTFTVALPLLKEA